jgi:hypothetical protein
MSRFLSASVFALRSASSILLPPDDVDLRASMRSLKGVANAEPSSPGAAAPSSSNGNIASPVRGAGLSAGGVALACLAASNRKSHGVLSRFVGESSTKPMEDVEDTGRSTTSGIVGIGIVLVGKDLE